MGKLLIDSIMRLDRPVVVAYLLVVVTLFIVINFVVDILYSLLDPRDPASGAPHDRDIPSAIEAGQPRGRALQRDSEEPEGDDRPASAASCLWSIAVIGPWIAPQNPYDLMQISIMDAKLAAGSESMAGATYWLGTDGQGRDMLSAMIYGLRTSLAVGVVSGVVALGNRYVARARRRLFRRPRRHADHAPRRSDARLPDHPRRADDAGAARAGRRQGHGGARARAMGIIRPRRARRRLVEKGKEYVEAATCLGLGKARILFGHLLPNCLPPLHRHRDGAGGERHLGGGDTELPRHRPADHRAVARPAHLQRLRSAACRASTGSASIPASLLVALVFSINIVGDRLREVLNPRLQR